MKRVKDIDGIRAGDFLVSKSRSGVVINIYLVEPDSSEDIGLTAVSFRGTGDKEHWMISDLVGRDGTTILWRLEPQEILKFLIQNKAAFND